MPTVHWTPSALSRMEASRTVVQTVVDSETSDHQGPDKPAAGHETLGAARHVVPTRTTAAAPTCRLLASTIELLRETREGFAPGSIHLKGEGI